MNGKDNSTSPGRHARTAGPGALRFPEDDSGHAALNLIQWFTLCQGPPHPQPDQGQQKDPPPGQSQWRAPQLLGQGQRRAPTVNRPRSVSLPTTRPKALEGSPTRPRAAEGPLPLNNVVQKLIYEPAPSQLWQVQEEEIHPLEHFQLGCRSRHFLGSQRAVSWADGLFLQALTVEFFVLVYAAYAVRI